MTKRIVITGRVQGVGFRVFTRQTADALAISGEVWNRRDDAVETLASHPEADVLDAFIERLRKGPGYVRDVQAFDVEEKDYDGFNIRPTR